MIEAVELDGSCNLNEGILLDRVMKGRNDKTQEFLILCENSLVGLLIYEHEVGIYDFIYEIFVLRDFRKLGIGTWILSYAETIAIARGKDGVRLQARSLYQDELNNADLTAWYEKKGYVQSSLGNDILEKAFL